MRNSIISGPPWATVIAASIMLGGGSPDEVFHTPRRCTGWRVARTDDEDRGVQTIWVFGDQLNRGIGALADADPADRIGS